MMRNNEMRLVTSLLRSLGCLCLVMAGLAIPPAVAASNLPEGKKAITLVAQDGSKQVIGSVTFTPDADGAKIAVAIDAPEFKEEFLSMRPFRCLPDAKEMWCHLAYPYAVKGRITADDLADLEYAMLFLFKPPAGYGIDAWNGLYFKLAMADGGTLSGAVHEADFNALAVPPDASVVRPIPHSALTPVSPDAHRFTRVVIE
jgi:hypothetical protein